MSDRDIVYHVLFEAILEIRERAAEFKDSKTFHLANLIYQLPHDIRAMDEWKLDASDVVRQLEERARAEGIEAWLSAKVVSRDWPLEHSAA